VQNVTQSAVGDKGASDDGGRRRRARRLAPSSTRLRCRPRSPRRQGHRGLNNRRKAIKVRGLCEQPLCPSCPWC
jgi:hypothetical protein